MADGRCPGRFGPVGPVGTPELRAESGGGIFARGPEITIRERPSLRRPLSYRLLSYPCRMLRRMVHVESSRISPLRFMFQIVRAI